MRETGSQWLPKIQKGMTKDYGLQRVFGVRQLFFKKEAKKINFIIAKATDDFLTR